MISGALKLAQLLYQEDKINGIIGLGGSMGTTLSTAVMRAFPIGFPKVMISTMASRDTRAFVGTRDILMLHSVCDLVGINRITARILHNGAAAMAGMIPSNTAMPIDFSAGWLESNNTPKPTAVVNPEAQTAREVAGPEAFRRAAMKIP